MGKFRPIKRGDREFCESLEILLECDPCRVRWLDQIPEHLERLIGKGDLRGAENLGRIVGDLAGKCRAYMTAPRNPTNNMLTRDRLGDSSRERGCSQICLGEARGHHSIAFGVGQAVSPDYWQLCNR